MVPPGSEPQFEWQVPVTAAAIGATLVDATLGPRGKWRKISADSQVYGFLYALSTVIRKTPWTKATNKVLELLEAMAMHCPIEVYPFAVTPDLSKELFLKSFQIMENFSIKKEEQGSTGWKMCCYFHQARKMVDPTKDVNDALVDFFGKVTFGASSECKKDNLNKLGRECLMFYDRVVTAGVTDLMPRCRIDLAPNNALDQLSKMIKISQTAAVSFDESEFPTGFRHVIQLLFVRMKSCVASEDVSVRTLARDEIPTLIGIVKLVKHLLGKFRFNGKAEAQVLANLGSAMDWFEKPPPTSEELMIVRASCRALRVFIMALYAGKWDHVFRELTEAGGSRRRMDATIANHTRFRLKEDVESIYDREKLQQENAAKFAASSLPIAEPVVEVPAASSQDAADNFDIESEAESEVGEDKEKKLMAARAKHVQAALEDAVRLVKRPSMKADYVALFRESLLVQNRNNFRPDDSSCSWRHGWFYDCSADQEPKIGDKSKHIVRAISPQPDAPVVKMFFEAVLSIVQDNDILIAPNARSAGASRTLLSSLSKAASTDILNIIYKEYPSRGRSRLHEMVHLASTKSFGLQPARARLHYQWTTTASDSIVQAADLEMPDKVEQQEKLAILGSEHLLHFEKMLKPTEKVELFHWEKPQEVYEEMLHHLRLTSLTTASCGRVQLLKACVKMQVKCLALYRSEKHYDILQRDLSAWMLEESLTNPQAAYYLSRKDLIEQLGLTPDAGAPGVPPAIVKDGDGKSTGKGGEDQSSEGESEKSKTGRKGEEEEEEEEEEEDEVIDPPPPKKLKGGAGTGKAKPKGKAKPPGKAKPKGKAKEPAPATAPGTPIALE